MKSSSDDWFPESLFSRRELLFQLTARARAARHKGSWLGPLWSVLEPLSLLALYLLVFGVIFDGGFRETGETGLQYALAVFLGLAVHHFVADAFVQGLASVSSQPNFVKKVVFPIEILPAAVVGASAANFAVCVGLICGVGAVAVPGLWVGLLWLPLVLAPLVLLALGLAWLSAAVGVYVRDLGHLAGFLSLALLFSSAVFYPIGRVPPELWAVLRFNPVLQAIDLLRHALLWGGEVDLRALGYLWASGAGLFFLGYWVFGRLRKGFADVI